MNTTPYFSQLCTIIYCFSTDICSIKLLFKYGTREQYDVSNLGEILMINICAHDKMALITRCHILFFRLWMLFHQMETFSTLLAICAGNSPIISEFPAQRPVTWSFGIFSDLRLNKRCVNKGEAGDLRRHCAHYDVIVMTMKKELHGILMTCLFTTLLTDQTVIWITRMYTCEIQWFCYFTKRKKRHIDDYHSILTNWSPMC